MGSQTPVKICLCWITALPVLVVFVLPFLWWHNYHKLRRELMDRPTAIKWATIAIRDTTFWLDVQLDLRFRRYMAQAYGPDDDGLDLIDSTSCF